MSTNKISDEKVRAEIIDNPNSFILSAPAGSGKTTLLAKRIVKRLLEVNDPNEIIALTFTKKAANEMSNKVKAVLKRTEKTFYTRTIK